MKLLLTSDWHMASPGDPACRIGRSNDDILRVLDGWERAYRLIVLNGDIFESLKSSRVRFDHFQHTQAMLDERRPIVERFLQPPYVWTVGNHDYPLERLLQLPMSVQRSLEHGMHLVADHGHLLRADREFYSEYHTVYHVLYCAGWWSSRLRQQLGIAGDAGDGTEALLHWYWRQTGEGAPASPGHVARLAGALLARISTPADRNLPDFMARAAEAQYRQPDALITMGHSHYFHRQDFSGARIYINTGRGYRRGRIQAVEFDTSSRSATRREF